jgi:hypothetical protein
MKCGHSRGYAGESAPPLGESRELVQGLPKLTCGSATIARIRRGSHLLDFRSAAHVVPPAIQQFRDSHPDLHLQTV